MNDAASSGPGHGSAHRFCTRCGAEGLQVESARCFRCARCGYRHFINPISAVAAILVGPGAEVLLLRRAHDPGKGKLGLPGGFVDVGETAEEALRREIREEIGLEIDGLQYFVSLPNEYTYQGVVTPVLDLFYTARLDSFRQARALAEVQELVVAPLRAIDFDQIAFPSNREALRRLASHT